VVWRWAAGGGGFFVLRFLRTRSWDLVVLENEKVLLFFRTGLGKVEYMRGVRCGALCWVRQMLVFLRTSIGTFHCVVIVPYGPFILFI
jgi:hypothetical protein